MPVCNLGNHMQTLQDLQASDDAVFTLLMSIMFCSSAGTIMMNPYCIRTSPLTSTIALLRFTLKRRLLLRSTLF